MNKHILHVEDDPIDQRFLSMAVGKADSDVEFTVASDGAEAIDLLQGGLKPSIIVMDLNMPGMDGRALLSAIKSSDTYRVIPAIVMSTADADREIRNCYERHANAYIVKPDTIDGYQKIAERLTNYWLNEVVLAA